MAFSSDADRREQLMLSFIAPEHPANTFTWGNLITLRDNVDDDALYKSLHDFRKRHYSAHRMCLAIQARLPMETLQKYVVTYFSKVPNNNIPPVDFKPFADGVFDTPAFKRLYYLKPVKDICQLILTWSMPSLMHLYKSKPHQYVGWLLGHEGKGSLISYLKKKIWALNISAGNSETGIEHNSMYTIFTITMVLTDDGFQNVSKVIEALFSYLNLLKKSGPQERIFREIQNIEENTFRFLPERTAADFVEALSENMHCYPPEHYLCGPELYFEYNRKAIHEVLDCLIPDKVNLILSTSKLPAGIEYEKTEKWFKTKYTDRDIPPEWIESWKKVETYKEFNLPEPNPYLTTNFDILSHSDVTEFPVKIYDTEMMEIWYRADTKFKLPIAYFYYYFITPLSLPTPQHAVMVDLYVTLLTLQLEEEAYPAEVAELHYSLNPGDKGITLRVDGYNDKLPLLLRLILTHMKSFSTNLTEILFSAVREKQMKYYYNNFIKPAKLVRDIRLSILTQQHWTAVDKHAAISNVTFEMLKDFGKTWLAHIYIQGLVQGNILKETALQITQEIPSLLKCGPMLPNTAPELRVRQIPLGEYSCTVNSFNKHDTNSTITNYYQSGPCSVRNMVLVEILMMIIEEPLFDILRTKEQLGYHLFCSLRDTFGILGYSITVNTQADKFSADHVNTRIEDFVKHATKLLRKMPKSEFLEIKNDLIKLKQCVDLHLKEEVQRNWSEISAQEFVFDRLHREVKCIKEVTQDELIAWFEQHTVCGNKKNLRKLSIQVIGNKITEQEVTEITAPKSSKKSISLKESEVPLTVRSKQVGAMDSEVFSNLTYKQSNVSIRTNDSLLVLSSKQGPKASPQANESKSAQKKSSGNLDEKKKISLVALNEDELNYTNAMTLQKVQRSVFYGANVEYPLVPIDSRLQSTELVKRNSCTVVVDMEDFKNGLFIYPINRMKMD